MTKLNEKNLNGRVYGTQVMESAIKRAESAFQNKELLSSVNEHPEEPYVTPGEASHVVVEAWVDGDIMMGKWEVLPTTNGNNLRALIEANVAFGVSIRGLGSLDNYGNILEDYDFLGCDCVGDPSAQLRVRPQLVRENARPNFATKDGKMNKDQTLKYLNEQRVLMANELTADKFAAYQRAAAVETVLSESTMLAKDLASVYGEWNNIKDTLFKEVHAKPVTESADKSSMYRKLVEQRSKQLHAMAAGLNQLATKSRAVKEAALVAQRRGNLKARALVTHLREAVGQSAALVKENVVLLGEATKYRLAYKIAVKEAARHQLAYRIAVKEAAKLARGNPLVVSEKTNLIESVWTFFTDADYQTFAGAGRPFGKMEPMISEGNDYSAILAGTDSGGTQIQMFVADGSTWAKDVGSWAEAYEFIQSAPKNVMEDFNMESAGFTLIGHGSQAESFKSKKGQVTEGRVLRNSKSDPKASTKIGSKESQSLPPGWM